MPAIELSRFDGAEALARAAAAAWLAEVDAANQAGKEHRVAVSGGRVAQKFFAFAAGMAKAAGTSFDRAHFFWADERCVPPDDGESNYRLAREFLLEPLGIPETRIHRIRGEEPPATAAAEAEEEIRRIVPVDASGQPVLDLVLLGMGEDGHVASLFPEEPEAARLSPAVYRPIRNSPKPPPNRVTLGYPAIAAATRVWVLVSGAGKQDAFRQSVEGSGATPLGRVLRMRRGTRLFVDFPE